MAREYSYSEIMEMQDKAIERVRQMQERAKKTVEENPIDASFPETEKVEEKPENELAFSPPPEDIPKNPFPQGIGMDKDKATVLPLLLLLMRDGADKLLLLALIYIMA